MANDGLIAGATGTGKTVTHESGRAVQQIGVPTFMADVKRIFPAFVPGRKILRWLSDLSWAKDSLQGYLRLWDVFESKVIPYHHEMGRCF
jgi:hypothetical protein